MIHDFATLLDDITQPSHRALAQHWLALYDAAGRQIPRLRAIDALSLGRHLPDICLLDHEGGNDFRFRLAGGSVNELYGGNVRHKLLGDLVSSPTRERLFGMGHAILSPPTVILHGMSGMLPQWNYSIAVQRISLPLAAEDGSIRHIISSTLLARHDGTSGSASIEIDFRRLYRVPLTAPAASAATGATTGA